MNVLLVEDELELSKALCAILKNSGYNTYPANDGIMAEDMLKKMSFDCVLLDIMLPRKDGFEVLKDMRKRGDMTPVIVLTAKSQTQDKVTGLDLGADDYLAKPFETEELLARLRAQTRRHKKEDGLLRFKDIVLDKNTYTLKSDRNEVLLSGTEYKVLPMLMQHKNEIISTEQFMEELWGEEKDVEINVVWVYISQLRKKIQQVSDCVQIKANRGRGYILVNKDA